MRLKRGPPDDGVCGGVARQAGRLLQQMNHVTRENLKFGDPQYVASGFFNFWNTIIEIFNLYKIKLSVTKTEEVDIVGPPGP